MLPQEGIPPAAASATDAHTLQVASGPPAAHQLPPSETLYSTNSAADQCRVNLPQVSHSQQAAALQSASAKLQDSTNRQLQHSSPSRHQQDTAQLGHPTSSSDAQIYTAQRQHHTGGESQKHQQQRDWSIPSHGQSTPQQQQQPQKSSLMPLQQQKQAGCDDGHDDGQIAAVHWHGPVAASGQQQEASMLLPSQLDQELYLQQPQSLFPHQQSTAPMQASQRTYQPGHLGPMTPQQHLQPFCDMPGVALQPSNQSMQLSFHVGSPSDRQQAASNSAVPVMQQPGVFSNSALPNQQPGSIVTQQLWSSSASMTYQPQAGPAQHQSQAYQAASVAQQHPNQPAAVMQQFVQRQSGWQVPPSQDSNIQFGATTASGFAISGQQQQQFAEQTVRRDAQGNSSAVTYSRSSSSHEFTFRTSRPPSNIPSPGKRSPVLCVYEHACQALDP